MFKVSDVVRVRKDLVVGRKYGDYILHPALSVFIGEKVVIKEITWQGLYTCYCETKNNWEYFSPEMLEPIPKAKEYSLIVTDKKVIILDKENKKRGLSECHEEDTFDFSIGVKLAWDRLHRIKEETPKPVEYKLYDCNGVELKEGDKVRSLCLSDGTFYNNEIMRNSNGILFNSGLGKTHRADRNNGRNDNSDTDYKWYVVKITK